MSSAFLTVPNLTNYFLKQILRATGKCFHPDCFKCEVCNKKLDGVQFTVDNFNQIHCIEDYYRYLFYDKFIITTVTLDGEFC